ncbi:aldehyde dehydrogenase (NADP(+)), partial [Paraburkholderia sp. Se-20369]|nr:aldehyde dehydrogenase (NADP(+)) [Paraburkholderia sp. Se-20369]
QGACDVSGALFEVPAQAFLGEPAFGHEVFGPSSLIVRCRDLDEMARVLEALEGQLTATLQMDADDTPLARRLLPALERKAGRLLVNGFPTGVEVCDAMVHGGPFPATSNPAVTSVGATAIERFLRPVCYQDFPDDLLPQGLQDANPLGVPRLRDGEAE